VKPVLARVAAERDVEQAAEYYSREAGEKVALDFAEALGSAYRTISERPGLGSPRYSHALGMPGLRTRKLTRFPFLIFYVERDDHVDVWRLLHTKRDIPAWLQDPD
jgi:toxin ParE1/3/4